MCLQYLSLRYSAEQLTCHVTMSIEYTKLCSEHAQLYMVVFIGGLLEWNTGLLPWPYMVSMTPYMAMARVMITILVIQLRLIGSVGVDGAQGDNACMAVSLLGSTESDQTCVGNFNDLAPMQKGKRPQFAFECITITTPPKKTKPNLLGTNLENIHRNRNSPDVCYTCRNKQFGSLDYS